MEDKAPSPQPHAFAEVATKAESALARRQVSPKIGARESLNLFTNLGS